MTHFPNRLALTAFVAAIGALAIPATAGATVTSDVTGNTLTVTSDDAPDTISLTAAGGFITVNGAATTLQANDNAQIVVNAGGGNDTVDASALTAANYGLLTINGGGEDDLVTGGADNDDVNGDAGNDRLVGFKGEDDVSGGDGNDTMVWNNGDATDVNNGDAGNDEVEVNGAPTAADTFIAKPGAQPGRVQFNRTNLGQFGIDLSAERLTVNGLGGGDIFQPDPAAPAGLAGLTSLTLNGGTGADHLTGGDGADVVNGGDDADLLDGGGGDDRTVGDRGADTHIGGDGDDVLVWNNGDGSDDNIGGNGFDRVDVNGSPTAGDAFNLAPDGADAESPIATFERTNLVPFQLGIFAGTEAVAVNGGGGSDEFVVSPGLPGLLVAADGDSGNDTLTGAEEADSFSGDSGSDTLDPGRGSDLADGGVDDDQLSTRDGVGDLVRGGAGMDSARTDSVNVDVTSGVEDVDATPLPEPPPAGDTKALLPELGKVKAVRDHRKLVARVPLSCPAAEAGGCRTTVTLETAKAVRLGKVRAVLVLGSKGVDLDPGEQSTVTVRLARGAAGLAKHGKLKTRVRIASSDAAGNLAEGSAAVGLRIPHR
jgi:Ca2+-binding RTX toxin-like protein